MDWGSMLAFKHLLFLKEKLDVMSFVGRET